MPKNPWTRPAGAVERLSPAVEERLTNRSKDDRERARTAASSGSGDYMANVDREGQKIRGQRMRATADRVAARYARRSSSKRR